MQPMDGASPIHKPQIPPPNPYSAARDSVYNVSINENATFPGL